MKQEGRDAKWSRWYESDVCMTVISVIPEDKENNLPFGDLKLARKM